MIWLASPLNYDWLDGWQAIKGWQASSPASEGRLQAFYRRIAGRCGRPGSGRARSAQAQPRALSPETDDSDCA